MEENMVLEILKDLLISLQGIVSIEGSVKEFTKFGNSWVIRFENGSVYKQQLISKGVDLIVMDAEHQPCDHSNWFRQEGKNREIITTCLKCGEQTIK